MSGEVRFRLGRFTLADVVTIGAPRWSFRPSRPSRSYGLFLTVDTPRHSWEFRLEARKGPARIPLADFVNAKSGRRRATRRESFEIASNLDATLYMQVRGIVERRIEDERRFRRELEDERERVRLLAKILDGVIWSHEWAKDLSRFVDESELARLEDLARELES